MKNCIKKNINRITHKNYIIKLEKLKEYEYPGSDEILMHSIFQVIIDFFDKKDGKNKNWNSDEETRNAYECLFSAYTFWKYDYKKFQKNLLDIRKKWYKEYTKTKLPSKIILKNGIEYKQLEFSEPSELQKQLELEIEAQCQILNNKVDLHLYKIVKYRDYLWSYLF